MSANKMSQFLPVKLNIHDHTYQHANTNCGQMSWTQIKKYIEFLSAHPIPDDSCVYDIETSAALNFYNERGHRPISLDAPYMAKPSQVLIHINMTSHKDCAPDHCLTNIANGKCHDEYVIKTIGRKFFADQYKQKNK